MYLTRSRSGHDNVNRKSLLIHKKTSLNKLRTDMRKHIVLKENKGSCPEVERSARTLFQFYNRCLNKNIYLQQLITPERRLLTVLKDKADEFFNELQSRHDNPNFIYSNGRIINHLDRMRIRMFIGTIKTFYTNYNNLFLSTRDGLLYALKPFKLNTDVINHITSFL